MDIEVILFDLGGVLIELGGVDTMMASSGLDEAELWRRWLTSNAVRDFESGRSTPAEFSRAVVEEFELGASPEEFIDAFTVWPRGPFDGAVELLSALRGRFHLACLSNTNHLHWERFQRETTLLDALDSHFASHQIGRMKPDPAIYEHAIIELRAPAASILFLDDNQVNVDAAIGAGMNAVLARGIDDVAQQLDRLGIHAARL